MFFGRNHLRYLMIAALALVVMIGGGRDAYADCANPTGVAGAMVYNTDYATVQFCNGTTWVSTAGSAAQSQWTASGSDIYYNSGGVAVGATSVNASALLDLTSTTKGFLPPRMTTAQVGAIASPAEGLIAYDTDTHQLKIYSNGSWLTAGQDTLGALSCASGEVAQYNGTAWICAAMSTTTGMNFKLVESGWASSGSSLPAAQYHTATAVIGDYFYSFGGYNSATLSNTIYRAPVNNPTAWVSVGTLPTAVSQSGIAIVGNYVYLFGGANASVSVNTIYRAPLSDPVGGWVNTGATLPVAIRYPHTTTIGNYVYIFGGYTTVAVNTIYRAPISDPVNGWVNTGATLPAATYMANMQFIGDYLYIFGGTPAYSAVQRAAISDPLTWTNMGNLLPGGIYGGTSAIIGDYVYIFGGHNTSTYTNIIYRAPLSDPVNSWVNTGYTLPSALMYSRLAIFGDNVYLFGGHNGSAVIGTIYRAPITLGIRQSAPVDVGKNPSWHVAYTANTGATQDPRIGNITNNKWCAVNGSGQINCDQNTPANTLASLTDVNVGTPSNGQSLVFNSTSSKWEAGAGDPLGTLSCSAGQTAQWNGTAWVCAAIPASSGMNYRMLENGVVGTGASIPGANHVGHTAVIGDYIYIFGGHNGSAGLNTIYRASINSPTVWTNTGSTLPGILWQSTLAIVGDYVYLFGGYNGSATLNSIWRAPLSNPTAWVNTGSTLPGPLYSSTVAVVGDYVYLYGGYNGSGYTNAIYRAPVSNPVSGWVNTGATLPATISHSQLVIIGNQMYLFGGIINGSYGSGIYSASTSSPTVWTNTGSTLPTAFGLSQSAIIGDYVYLLGGYNGSAYTGAIYRAPLSSPTAWTNTGYNLPNSAAYAQVAVIGDNIYFFGGYLGGGAASAIWRGPILLGIRQSPPVDIGRNPSWLVAYTANTGATQDLRIGSITNNKWCAVNGSGSINCDQNTPATALANLTDVNIGTPVGGQSLVFNSTSSKWEGGPGDPLGSLSCSSGEISQWNGTTWVCSAPAATSGMNYKLIENGWVGTGSTLPAPVYGSASATIGDYVYLFGGWNGAAASNVIYRAPVSNPTAWVNTGSTLPGGIYGSSVAVIGNYVYLFGGYTNTIYRAPVANPVSGWVNTGSTLPGIVGFGSIAVVGNYVYLYGGTTTGATALNTIYRASVSDPTTWTNPGSTMATGVFNANIAVVGDYVYIFGGNTASGSSINTIQRAPVSNPLSWSSVGTLPIAHNNGPLAIIGDYLYLFGGATNGAVNATTFRASMSDPLSWSNTGYSLPGAIQLSALAVVGDYVYILGGWTSATTNAVWRAPIGMGIRQTAPLDIGKNPSWKVAYSANTGASQDPRVGTLNNGKWCVTNSSGIINCDQNAPTTTLAALTDVNAPTPSGGQSLVFNSTSSKWEAGAGDPLGTLSCATGETPQYNGTAWVCAAIPASSGMNYRLAETGWVNTGTALPGTLYGSQLAVIGDYIYMFGGWISAGTNVIYRAPVSNPTAWTNTGSTISTAVFYSNSAVIGDYIYLFGGWNSGSTATNVVQRASLTTPTSWTNVGTLPAALGSSATVVVGDYVYLYGGWNGTHNNVIYRAPVSNPSTGWVNTGSTLPANIANATPAVIGDYIYLFGGNNASQLNTIYRASVSTPTVFTSVGTMPFTATNAVLKIIGDYVYLLAGTINGSYSAGTYRAPVSDPTAWTNYSVGSLPAAMGLSAGAIIGDYAYLFGGYNGSALSVIYRAPITLSVRQSAPVDVGKNPNWRVAYSTHTGATQDLRIGTLSNSKWCATNASGQINCDQAAPANTLAGLTDVNAPTPAGGQSLVFNSTSSKWEAMASDPLATLSCVTGETPQYNGTAWVCAAIPASSGVNYKLVENGFVNTGATLAAPRYGSTTVIIDDYIYFYGGNTGAAHTNTIYRAPVNNPTAVVNTGATLPTILSYARPYITGGYIYLFAGYNGTSSDTIYRAPLNNPTAVVNTGATLPTSVSMPALAVIGDYMYLYGGAAGSYLNVIQRAAVSAPTVWSNYATLPIAVGEAQVAVIGDYVYLYGGRNGGGALNSIYRANVSTPTSFTNTGATLPATLFYSNSAIIGDYIYIFGGYNSAALNILWRAPLSDPTSFVNTMYTIPASISLINMAIIQDNIYLYSGYNGSGTAANTIYRAPITLGIRQGAPMDVGKNPSWLTAYSTNTGATQDLRIGMLGANKWCATNGSGQINCDQNTPISTLAGLTDVNIPTPSGGQSLVFNSTSSKWEAGAGDPLGTLSCASGQTPQWNGTTWVCAAITASTGVNYTLNESGWVTTGYSLPAARYQSASFILDGYMYAIGGNNGSTATNTIYRASVSNPLNWTSVGTFPANIQNASVAIVGSYVYIFGGYNGSAYTNTIWRAPTSDPVGGWVNTGSTLPGTHGVGAIAVVNDYIYLYGGWNGSAFLNTIWRAPVSNPLSWTNTGSTLPALWSAGSIAVIGDYVYLFGGENGGGALNVVWRAPVTNPASMTSAGTTLPATRYYGQLFVIGDYVYIVAGSGSNTMIRAPLSDPTSWAAAGPAMPANSSNSAAFAVGNDIYLVGGHNGSAAVATIMRAPLTLGVRESAPIDVGKNPSWRVAYSVNTGAAQDLRIGTLVANNYCVANAGGTAIDCTQASAVTTNTLDFAQFKDAMTLDAATDIAASGTNVLSITNSGTGNSFVVNDEASDTTPFVVDAAGNVGIGTLTPNVALDVVGAIVSRANNAGSATSIDFTTANVAYTTAACGAFTLTGMQDGGSYVLVVKGSGTGPATFTHSGLTPKSSATFACTSAKHTVFALIRAGTDLYVSYITGY